MRVMPPNELSRLSRAELMALMRTIAAALPGLKEASIELRNAHASLHNIRCALARPGPGFRP